MRRKGEYIRKRWFSKKGDWDISIKKEKETRRTLREETEQCNFLYNIGLLGQACKEIFAHLFYNISLFFLIFILGQSPILLVISLSNKFIDLGQGWIAQLTILSGPRLPDFFVLTCTILYKFAKKCTIHLCLETI